MNTGLQPTTGHYADPVLLIVDDTDDDITEILHVACDGFEPRCGDRHGFRDGGHA